MTSACLGPRYFSSVSYTRDQYSDLTGFKINTWQSVYYQENNFVEAREDELQGYIEEHPYLFQEFYCFNAHHESTSC